MPHQAAHIHRSHRYFAPLITPTGCGNVDELDMQLIKLIKEDLILYIQVVSPQICLLKFKSNIENQFWLLLDLSTQDASTIP